MNWVVRRTVGTPFESREPSTLFRPNLVSAFEVVTSTPLARTTMFVRVILRLDHSPEGFVVVLVSFHILDLWPDFGQGNGGKGIGPRKSHSFASIPLPVLGLFAVKIPFPLRTGWREYHTLSASRIRAVISSAWLFIQFRQC